MASAATVTTNAQRLQGNVAVITGAARGIGEGNVRLFVEHGARVVILDILDDLGHAMCLDLGHDAATYLHCDVSDEDNVQSVVNFAVAKHGKIDIMVNNAAATDLFKPSILDNEKSDIDCVIADNLKGVFLGTKHAAHAVIHGGKGGSILIIASVCSVSEASGTHAYTSSKNAVVGLAKNVAAELGKYQIRADCLSPHLIPTPAALEFFKIDKEKTSGVYSNPKGLIMGPEDIAAAALFLASDEFRYMSRHDLVVDSGFTVINPAMSLYS